MYLDGDTPFEALSKVLDPRTARNLSRNMLVKNAWATGEEMQLALSKDTFNNPDDPATKLLLARPLVLRPTKKQVVDDPAISNFIDENAKAIADAMALDGDSSSSLG